MKLGILKCGAVRPAYSGKHGQYADMFKSLMAKTDDGDKLEYQVYDVMEFDYPAALDDCDAYLTTGSKHSVYDDDDWIKHFQGYITELYIAGKKTVGVCFGHQMIAAALGGEAGPAGIGWGVGSKSIDIVSTKPWMQPAQTSYKLFVSHQDQVLRLPKGAELVGTSEYCPNSMYVIGEQVLSMQGHPEFTAEYSHDLARARIESIGEATFSEAEQTFSQPVDQALLANWIYHFIQQ